MSNIEVHNLSLLEIESLRKRIRYSRTKTLAELVLSAAMLVTVYSITMPIMYDYSIISRYFVILPVVGLINGIAWMIWMQDSMMSLMHRFRYKFHAEESTLGMEAHQPFERNLYDLIRHKRTEGIVDILTALQFVGCSFTIGLVMVVGL